MRRLAGQAARHTGRALHLLAELAIAFAVLCGVLGWRLSQGPLELPWLTKRVEAALNQDRAGGHITIASAALAWEGFRLGVDRPLDIRLRGVSFAGPNGRQVFVVPAAEVSLSLHSLLLGRIMPRALEIDQPRVSLARAANGSLVGEPGAAEAATDPGPLLALLTELARPPTTEQGAPRASPLSELRRVRIHDAALEVRDHQLGVTWQAPHADIDLTRRLRGGVDATANLTLVLGTQQAQLTASANLPPGKGPIRLRARLGAVVPAAVARLLPQGGPAAASLAAIDAPISTEADLRLDDAMALQSLRLTLQAGAGSVHIADGALPIVRASVVADLTPDQMALNSLRLELPSHPGAPPSVVQVTGEATRAPDQLTAALRATLDQVDFADLPRLWPIGIAHGARAWITENVTAGVAQDGQVALDLEATPDLASVTLTRATGTLAGEGLRVSWLAPVPPLEQGAAVLTLLDPDTLEIALRTARQAPEPGTKPTGDGLWLRGGRVQITGLMQKDQFATIEADVDGPVADAIALLRDPRLRLLSKHPLPLTDPTGQMTGHLSIALPLEERLTMDEIAIQARAHLEDVHLGSIVAGQDLDHGVLNLAASAQGLTLTGQASLAGIPADLSASLDFRAGGPAQVLQRIAVTGQPTARALAAAGLDAGPALEGTVGLSAIVTERRDGAGEIAVSADLTPAALAVPPLGWRKPAGIAAKATARLVLARDRLTAIDGITLDGEGMGGAGSVTCVDGKPAVIRLDQIVLGRTEARGTIRLPQAAAGGDGPIAIAVTGPRLDLSARFAQRHAAPPVKAKPQPPSGPHWTLDAHFDQAIMAEDHRISGLTADIDSDGGLLRRLRVTGETAPGGAFSAQIALSQGKRTVNATAANAGELLAALDIVKRMEGGKLSLTGSYDDTRIDHPLDGTVRIEDFSVRNAPVLARLLQAMTLYGLVEALRGPGLGFGQLIAPFQLTDNAFTLTDARAFSSSLGLTAKGTIDLDTNTADLEGTIVPAYFFNSLLGNIPLVGRLLSPERGGGVFAAGYTVRGPLEDPNVAVNPLSALTPGVLRQLFGLF